MTLKEPMEVTFLAIQANFHFTNTNFRKPILNGSLTTA